MQLRFKDSANSAELKIFCYKYFVIKMQKQHFTKLFICKTNIYNLYQIFSKTIYTYLHPCYYCLFHGF